MCGIAGIYAYHNSANEVDRDELRTIRDHMISRGPDGKGEWYSENNRVGLAHRRLSIIDLSEDGAQPMQNQRGNLVVTFNGEIYNYRALRSMLEQIGYVFQTNSDTEVLLHLYTEKGDEMVHDLRGMFAFALWDANKNALLLARDPYGIKPLYYADDGWTVRIASQVKAIKAGGKVSEVSEPAGLVGFYLFGHVPEPYTTWQDIRSLPAGSTLWINQSGPSEPRQYFSIAQIFQEAEQNQSSYSEQEAQQIIREALLDSVQHHQMADVPVGAFLSAGIDSSALVALMTETRTNNPLSFEGGGWGEGGADINPIQTITLAFEEYKNTHDDESRLASKVSNQYRTQHTTHYVSEEEFQEDLPKILKAMDQPTIDGINTWFVSKIAKEQGLKVAISGLGGDELFGGYPSFTDIPRWVKAFSIPSRVPFLGKTARCLGNVLLTNNQQRTNKNISPKALGMVEYGGTYEGAYLLRRGLFMPWELDEIMDKEIIAEGLERLQPLNHIANTLIGHKLFADESTQRHKVHSGFKTPKNHRDLGAFVVNKASAKVSVLESSLYMRNQLLRDTDWSSMAHSLEVRVPLVDITLLRKIAPVLISVQNVNNKNLMANAPKLAVPHEVINRLKTGFTTPIQKWLENKDLIEQWENVEILDKKSCLWARRWAYVTAKR